MPKEWNPWTASLEDIAEEARKIEALGRKGHPQAGVVDAERAQVEAAWLLEVLRAKTALEVAGLQRRQTFGLVLGTWALVLATAALVIVTLFIRPEVVVEVPAP